MNELLRGLKAAAEPTRLRILSLCAHAELTVSDLVEILGQSQPRVSRHLRLLVEAGLLQPNQEGAWAWYRLPAGGTGSELAHTLVDLLPQDDRRHAADLQRLQSISEGWARRVERLFPPACRGLGGDPHSPCRPEERRSGPDGCAWLRSKSRTCSISAPVRGISFCCSRRGQSAASASTSRRRCSPSHGTSCSRPPFGTADARQADMTALPFETGSFRASTSSMVLHFAEEPAAVIAEAARVLRPGGKAVLVDFAEHEMTSLREEQAHRWLGFDDRSVQKWARRYRSRHRPRSA